MDNSPYDNYENILPRVRTKNEILKLNEDIFKEWRNIPDNNDIYLVASFNYWFPIKMAAGTKTLHLLKSRKAMLDKLDYKKAHLN